MIVQLEEIEREVRRNIHPDLLLKVDFYVWRHVWRPLRLRLRERLDTLPLTEMNQ